MTSVFMISACASDLRSDTDMDKNSMMHEINANDITAIQKSIDGAWHALEIQDLNHFYNFCSRDWKLYTASGKKLSSQVLFDMHKKNIENFKVIPSNIEIKASGKMGWATYDAKMSGSFKGSAWGGEFIFTNIFHKINGKWECIHMHESKRKT